MADEKESMDDILEGLLAELQAEDDDRRAKEIIFAGGRRNYGVNSNGLMLNPNTGKLVKMKGVVGKRLIAERTRELGDLGALTPAGKITGARLVPFVPARDAAGAILPPRGRKQVTQRYIAPGLALENYRHTRRVGVEAQNLRIVGAFRSRRFTAADPARVPMTISELAVAIEKEAQVVPNYRHTQLAFIGERGERVTRVVHARTAGDIKKGIERIESGMVSELGAHGVYADKSDAISITTRLDPSQFWIGYTTFEAGGALKFTGTTHAPRAKTPYFVLVDLTPKAAPGDDCLLHVLRAVAKAQGLELPKRENRGKIVTMRNDFMREAAGIAPGPIEASAANIERLAELFGMRVRIIVGMEVPPDAEREYDDNGQREHNRNRCITQATPIVLAEGGGEGLPACDVHLAEGHYEYIKDCLPVPTCLVTGDILTAVRRSPSEVARRVVQQGRMWHGDGSVLEEKRDQEEENYCDVCAKELGTPAARLRHMAGAKHAKAVAGKSRHSRVVVFDYETTFDPVEGELTPYALGYVVFDPDKAGEDFSDPSVAARVFLGDKRDGRVVDEAGVTAPLMDLLECAPPDVTYTLVGFNSARFDNFILTRAAHMRDLLTSVFPTAGGGIRGLTIGRHRALDLAKILTGTSLADACGDFKTVPQKVEGFSHEVPQMARERGQLVQWIHDNKARLDEYLVGDVLSTASLFQKTRRALAKLDADVNIITDSGCGTVGGIAWKMMSKRCRLPKAVASQELDEWIRSAVTGGRVQVFRPDEPAPKGVPLRMVDFVSLYPTAMAAPQKLRKNFDPEMRWGCYPSGTSEPEEVADYTPGDVGVYEVDIKSQPPNLPNVLPKRIDGEPLDWSFRGPFRTRATHVEIALIRKYGGEVDVVRGYRWQDSKLALFEPFVMGLAALKNEQDLYKETSNPKYNPALRAMIKTIMNGASGKCCQRNYDDCAVIAKGSIAQHAAAKKMDQTQRIRWIPIGVETCVIVGKKPSAKVYTTKAKPSILAVLIYAYSRALFWRILGQYEPLYGDTDSAVLSVENYERLVADFPELDRRGRDKELGDLDEELGPHAYADAYFLAPKDYAIFMKNADGSPAPKIDEKTGQPEIDKKTKRVKLSRKIRAKGVNMRGDRVAREGEGETIKRMSFGERHVEYREGRHSDPIKDDPEAFYARRERGEVVTVLCGQLTRSFKTSATPFELRQQYLAKEMTLPQVKAAREQAKAAAKEAQATEKAAEFDAFVAELLG